MDQQNEGEMMDDRELLEMAAKAAFGDKSFIGDMTWNPLTSDSDALRLAVKLRINLHFCESDAMTTAYAEGGIQGAAVDFMDDPYAATRRAIVRAAAELARAGAQKG